MPTIAKEVTSVSWVNKPIAYGYINPTNIKQTTFLIVNNSAYNSYTYLMHGYAPELAGMVQWISANSPNFSPSATNPTSVVVNLTNKSILMRY